MKGLLVIIAILGVMDVACQDLLVTSTGDSLNCKIIKIKNDFIYYEIVKEGMIRKLTSYNPDSQFVYEYYGEAEQSKDRIAPQISRYKWNFRLGGGLSYVLGKPPTELSIEEREYSKDLNSGGTYQLDLSFFLSKSMSLGLQASSFRSRNAEDNIVLTLPDGTKALADISDNVTLGYVGLMVKKHIFMKEKRGGLTFASSVGYTSFQNDATIDRIPLSISGNTFGIGLSLGYEVMVLKEVGLSFTTSLFTGTITELKVNSPLGSTNIKLEKEQYQKISRLEFSIAIVVYK